MADGRTSQQAEELNLLAKCAMKRGAARNQLLLHGDISLQVAARILKLLST